MELHLFNTENVDNKLSEIKNLMHILELASHGLMRIETFEEYELESFQTIIDIAIERIDSLKQSMKPFALDWEEGDMLLIMENT